MSAAKRQTITDDSGRYFYLDKAEKFEEKTKWNGNNHISLVTGSQWEHEALYRTAEGRWILNHWSQWQGSKETWVEVNNEAAAKWLVICGHDAHKACQKEFEELEIK